MLRYFLTAIENCNFVRKGGEDLGTSPVQGEGKKIMVTNINSIFSKDHPNKKIKDGMLMA